MRYHEYGDANVLRHEEADRPVPGAGQVLLEVAATTFNPVDAGIRGGYLQQVFMLRFPHIPGLDVAGTVADVGDGVSDLRIGDQVIGFLPMDADGATADFVLAPAEVLTAAPTTIPLAEAAALPSAGLSAWQSLFELADLRAGQRILINGAGGAVGGYAVQLATRAGAVVIATASPRSTDIVRRLGADQVIDHTSTAVAEAMTEAVDVVLNLAPAQDLGALGALANPGGVLVTTVPAAPVPEDNGLRVKTLFVRSDPDQLAQLVGRVDAGHLIVAVAAIRPFTDLAAIHQQSDTGSLRGKVVLVPARK